MRENRIEVKLAELKKDNQKALITYVTAGLPSLEKTIELAEEEYGVAIKKNLLPNDSLVLEQPERTPLFHEFNLRNSGHHQAGLS